MRKVLFFCISMLCILLIAPILASYIWQNETSLAKQGADINAAKSTLIQTSTSETPSETTKTTEKPHIETDEETEYIISLAISISDESFCDEGLKAVLGIAKNNYNYSVKENNEPDSINITKYSDEFFSRLCNLYSDLDLSLSYKNQCVYIPTSSLSNGNTLKSEEYTYMQAVASPWDCLSSNFVYAKEYSEGVSLYGLDYLCKEGLSCKEALRWYLPEFSIQ